MRPHKLPITALIAVKNEAARIEKCLAALGGFAQVLVVDSCSTDDTAALAKVAGAEIVSFAWNGAYPKKRQWCLDNLGDVIAHDWVFFVDADEIVTPDLVAELQQLDTDKAGYFVRGAYVFEGAALRYGMANNKLALINRHKLEFPIVDDIGLPGMGEIEGHYQPVLKAAYQGADIGQIKAPLLHEACTDMDAWHARHQRYAAWERGMDERVAWPAEDTSARRVVKRIFRAMPAVLRGFIAFGHSYLWKLGALDGARGYRFARLRAAYYWGS